MVPSILKSSSASILADVVVLTCWLAVVNSQATFRSCGVFRSFLLSANNSVQAGATEESDNYVISSNESVAVSAPLASLSNKRTRAIWALREGGDNFEGDIILPNECTSPLRSGYVASDESFLWRDNTIPYIISSEFSSIEKATIDAALKSFGKLSCLQIRPWRRSSNNVNDMGDYVLVVKGDGCSSAVGRQGGRQLVTLADGCVHSGTIQHEFMHAAGFWHEQSRPDRDQHVRIHWSNIERRRHSNFQKYTWHQRSVLAEPYDPGSVMHYGPFAFAVDSNRPTISALIAGEGAQMGQRRGLSAGDIRKLNRLYSCPSTHPPPSRQNPTAGDRCEDENDNCRWWAGRGECSANPSYMLLQCRRSCRQCAASGTSFTRDGLSIDITDTEPDAASAIVICFPLMFFTTALAAWL